MLIDLRGAGVGVESSPVLGCRVIREPDVARVYENSVDRAHLTRDGELPTATGRRVNAANPVPRCRIPHNAGRIDRDAMWISACRHGWILLEVASTGIEPPNAATQHIGVPNSPVRRDCDVMKLDVAAWYPVVHDPSTRGADWSRDP